MKKYKQLTAAAWFLLAVFGSLFIIGNLFKIFRWPNGQDMYLTGLLTSCGLLISLTYLQNAAGIKRKPFKKIYLLLLVPLVGVTLIGFAFRFMHWIYGAEILIITHATWTICAATFCIYKGIDALRPNKEDEFLNSI